MKVRKLMLLLSMSVLFFAGPAARGQDQTPPPPPPPADSSATPAPSLADQATSPGAREMLRLKDAGYSEDFLLKKVEREKSNYQLTTNDLILLRKAGFSEKLIEAMLTSGTSASAPSDAPASPTPAAMSSAPANSTSATSAATPAATSATMDSGTAPSLNTSTVSPNHTEFDGLVRQTSGFLGVGGSKTKHVGKIVVDGQKISWYEEADPEENFSMYTKNIKEMWLNCAPRSGENLCLEVGFKNFEGNEWTFRDTGWANGENKQVTAIYDYFQKNYPADFFSKREKKSF